MQEPVPLQGALHPVKTDPLAAEAVNVTELPLGKAALQVVSQLLMPTGALLIVPVPAPALVTVSV